MASVKSNYIFNTLNTISGMFFPLITFPYVARVLMPEGIGLINFYNSIIGYITLLCCLGIPMYGLRQTALVKSDKRNLTKVTFEILLINVLTSIIGYLIVVICCITVPQIRQHWVLFLLMSLNIIFVVIGCDWFYQGIEDFKYITIRNFIVRVISTVLLFLLVKTKEDIFYYGLYIVIGNVGGNIFNFYKLNRQISYKDISFRELQLSTHIRGILKIFLLTIIGSLYLQLDTVMLGFMANNESVGFYSGAVRLTKLIMGIVTSLGVVLLPRLSSLTSEHDSEYNALLKKSNDFILMLSTPLALGLILISKPLILIFCGADFEPSINVLQILSPIIIFIGLSYISAQSNFARGKINTTIYVGLLGAFIDILLNFILIPQYLSSGAAIATTCTELSIIITYIIISIRRDGKYLLGKIHILKVISSSIIMYSIGYLAYTHLSSNISQLIIVPVLGMIIYSFSLYLMKDETFIDSLNSIRHKIA